MNDSSLFTHRKSIAKEMVFQLLSKATGIHFEDSIKHKFFENPSAFETRNPFTINNIKEISCQRKILEIGTEEKLLALIKLKSQMESGVDPATIGHFLPDMSTTIKYHLVFLENVKNIFGENSKCFAIQALRVALAYYQNAQYDQAQSFINAAIRGFVSQKQINIEALIIIFYLKGSLKHQLRQYAEAEQYYLIALGVLSRLSPPSTLRSLFTSPPNYSLFEYFITITLLKN
jgi:tetratricopeptide (TPR) repeat protein